ncbi:AraC family transcriptional regulator [uncultured Eudoraea sp.]|uniref:helix-turn-helix domain-containing protein n=1 Tax=uncultured Eudoraea sp. TaxID=1035614 RepID=UPI0026198953|nr:helix-turn-helix domain-containing protein [uncultured Eudoraea sp.]
MNYNLGALLSILVAFQFLFLALYLFTNKKGINRNNRLLALLFFLFAINLIDFAARVSGSIFPNPMVHLLDDTFFLLYGPILYFYCRAVIFHDFAFKKRDAWHLLPFAIYIFLVLFLIVSLDKESGPEIALKITTADFPAWVYIISLFIYLHILYYLWISWRTVETYHTVIKDKYSSIDGIKLDWLNFMLRAFTVITIVAMIHNLTPIFSNRIFLYVSVTVLLLTTFYFINLILVKALNQPAIFSGIAKKETEKYAMSNLSPVDINKYKNQLTILMQTEQLYLNPDLNSKDLAKELGISGKTLSQVINQGFDQNFYDFINTFRCEEVKKILQGPDKKMTIIEAMFQAGFNSKSSFNKEFKKLTGQTPSEFKKSLSQI